METEEEDNESGKVRSHLHIFFTCSLILATNVILNGYLVDQNKGSRKTGVLVLLVIGDVCLCLLLKYIAVVVGREVTTTKRGYSMVEWCLFILVLDVKMYFLLASMAEICSENLQVNSSPLKALSSSTNIGQEEIPNSNVHVDKRSIGEEAPLNALSNPCEYSLAYKKMLTLSQTVLISGLYLLLVGADHIRTLNSFRAVEEMNMRAFWIVIDLFDIADLQSTMWEAEYGQLPFSMIAFVYFYCFFLFLFLPPLSLAEIWQKMDEVQPHKMIIYLFTSLCFINIGLLGIRLSLLFQYNFSSTSSVFLGKNIVCLGIKVGKIIRLWKINISRFPNFKLSSNNHLEFDANQENVVANGDVPFVVEEGNYQVSSSDGGKANSDDDDIRQHLHVSNVNRDQMQRQDSMDYSTQSDWKQGQDTSDFSMIPRFTSTSSINGTSDVYVSSQSPYSHDLFKSSFIRKVTNLPDKRKSKKSKLVKDQANFSPTSESESDRECQLLAGIETRRKSDKSSFKPVSICSSSNTKPNNPSNNISFQKCDRSCIITPPVSFASGSNFAASPMTILRNSQALYSLTSPTTIPRSQFRKTNSDKSQNIVNSKSLSEVSLEPLTNKNVMVTSRDDVSLNCINKLIHNEISNLGNKRESNESDTSDFPVLPRSMELLKPPPGCYSKQQQQQQQDECSETGSTSI